MKQYKLIEATTLYQGYLDYFYANHPQTIHKSYKEHLQDLLYDANAECDFIHRELHKLGIESSLYFINAQDLQRSWNPEFAHNSLFEIFCEQLKQENPDILLISAVCDFTLEQLHILREIMPKHAKMAGYHFTIIDPTYQKLFTYFDQIYTGSNYYVNLLKPYCNNVRLLRHAFSPLILDRIKKINRDKSAIFAGSIFIGEDIHTNRIDMFYTLIQKKIPVDFYGTIHGSFFPSGVKSYIKQLLQNDSVLKRRKYTEKKLKNIAYPPAFGLEYYERLAEHLVCINSHAPIAHTGSGNMRMFEATGMGCCLLTDYRQENASLFDVDNEIVVYNDLNDFTEKLVWLIQNPEKAKQIAQAGQNRTLKDYTYKNKAECLHEYLNELL